MASLSICVCEKVTRDPTIINKARTREFTHEIIVIEIQVICRMKNDKQAWEYNEKHMTTQSYNKQPNNTRLTQIWHQGNLTWNRAHQTIVI